MRVLIAGGGTGGHLFPGVAIAEELLRRGGHGVSFVGTARGIEARVLPRDGFALDLIDVAGLKGAGGLGLARALVRVPRALAQSAVILRRRRPDLVVGVGGYASGPVVLMAWLRGVPTAILEQNSVPGITNRILGRLVRRVFLSFEDSAAYFPRSRVERLGNPIRARLREAFRPATPDDRAAPLRAALQHGDAATQQESAAPPRKPSILVLGGSQGAHAVNELVVAALALLAAEGRAPGVLHQVGAADLATVEQRYRAAGVAADVRAFIDDIAPAYAGADLVVARAGATTLAEITALGRASLLIPYPFATDDHQARNAAALASAGAAEIHPEATTSPRRLADAIAGLLADSARRDQMESRARAFGRPDAAAAIVDRLIALATR